MLYYDIRTFAKEEKVKEKIEKFLANAKEQMERAVNDNRNILYEMKKANLPDYLLRRVVYDDSVWVESFANDLRRMYVYYALETHKEKITSTVTELVRTMWHLRENNGTQKNMDSFMEVYRKYFYEAYRLKDFSNLIYPELRRILRPMFNDL